MTAVTLYRIDPACNMRRLYALDVQPDLFSGFTGVKEWGRIVRRSRMIGEPNPDRCRCPRRHAVPAKRRCGHT